MSDQERVEVRCYCGAKLKVPAAALGRKARCPKCQKITVLHAPEGVTATRRADRPAATTGKPTAGTAQQITVRCECGAKLAVPAAAAGHRAKCPKCSQAVAIPKRHPPAATPAVAAASGPLDGLLDALADGQAVEVSPEQRAAMKATVPTGEADIFKLAPSSKPTKMEAEEEPVKGAPIKCPGCAKDYPPNAKICPACGINLKTGRALITTDEENLDRAYSYAENVLSWLSWLFFTGLYPFASEAFGLRTPWVTRGIAVVTILISMWYFVVVCYNDNPSPAHLELMFWAGEGESGLRSAEDAWAQTEEYLRDEGLNDQQIETIRASGYMDVEPSYVGAYKPHQLLTHIFLHADPIHLAGNMLFLMVLGARVNALIGNVLTFILYPLLGIVAALAQAASMAGEPLTANLGASGAVMGLAGMYLILFPIHKVHMVFWWRWGLVGGFQLNMKMFALRGFWVVLFYIAFDVFYTVIGLEDNVAHWAHLGGFLAGMGIALILLFARLANGHGGDILTAILGRHAWALIGKPNRRGITLW